MTVPATTWWFVGCRDWASGKITHEKDAKDLAKDLDDNSTCSREHYYWFATAPPPGPPGRPVPIPEGAQRP